MKPAFTLRCEDNDTDYWIYVHSPKKEPSNAACVGAVLFMDGDDQFGAAVKAYDEQFAANAVEPLLLVGIGYGASYTKPANRRGRDYTPVAHSDEPTSGGADVFLKFLVNLLWSEIHRRYEIGDAIRGIAGHSLGSLLVLHALFQPRPFFTHFLASAPAIWWANSDILRQAEKLRDQQAKLPGELYLAIGENDTQSMNRDLVLLENQLATKPFEQLHVSSRRFPHRDHYNVLPDSFGAGFKILFGQQHRPTRSGIARAST